MKFNVILKEDLEDGGYVVSCPALPGCHSQGETIEGVLGALENIKDAIKGCMEVINERAMKEVKERIMEVVV